jgi:hypothetical protein
MLRAEADCDRERRRGGGVYLKKKKKGAWLQQKNVTLESTSK